MFRQIPLERCTEAVEISICKKGPYVYKSEGKITHLDIFQNAEQQPKSPSTRAEIVSECTGTNRINLSKNV